MATSETTAYLRQVGGGLWEMYVNGTAQRMLIPGGGKCTTSQLPAGVTRDRCAALVGAPLPDAGDAERLREEVAAKDVVIGNLERGAERLRDQLATAFERRAGLEARSTANQRQLDDLRSRLSGALSDEPLAGVVGVLGDNTIVQRVEAIARDNGRLREERNVARDYKHAAASEAERLREENTRWASAREEVRQQLADALDALAALQAGEAPVAEPKVPATCAWPRCDDRIHEAAGDCTYCNGVLCCSHCIDFTRASAAVKEASRA